MSGAISWNLQLNIRDGKLDELTSLAAEMSEATKLNEPDTLVYEWYVDANNKTCHVIENYTDSAAVMVHMGTFGEKFAERFMGCLEPTGLTVYGQPSDEVRGVLDGLGAVYLSDFSGFRR